jgi:hypothetical protein
MWSKQGPKDRDRLFSSGVVLLFGVAFGVPHLEGEEFKPEKSGIRSNIAVKRHN